MKYQTIIFSLVILGLCCELARSYHVCDRDCQSDIKPKICDYVFNVTLSRTLNPDHCGKCPIVLEDCYNLKCIVGDGIERPLYLVNDMFPGPDITVCEGDMVRITVTNALVGGESITLHWHGIHQIGSPYMDGTPMITQCPINMAAKFRYQWKATPAGSKFWHAHTSAHRVDGIVGPLLVRPRYKSTRIIPKSIISSIEFSVIVQEWKDSLSPFHFIKDDEAAPSLLINGRQGVWPDSPPTYFLIPKTSKQNSNLKAQSLPLFRFTSNGFLYCPIVITVEKHDIIIAGTDGFSTMGRDLVRVQALTIFPGERYDVWLANIEPSTVYGVTTNKMAYKISVVSFGECDHGIKVANASAYLIYVHNESFDDVQAIGLIKNELFNEQSNINNETLDELKAKHILNPVHLKDLQNSSLNVPVTKLKMDAPFLRSLVSKLPDYKIFLFTDSFLLGADIPMFNNISFIPTSSPLLTQTCDVSENELCNIHTRPHCNGVFCRCTHLYQIKLGSLVELIIVDEGLNGEYDIHSIHLHGYHFAVLAQEKLGDTLRIEEVKRLDKAGKLVRNLRTPIIKDTIAIPEGGYVIIRFLAKNPGTWMLHCHLDFHLMKGMALIFRVGEQAQMPSVPPYFPKCGDWLDSNYKRENPISFQRFAPAVKT